jgi:hypothetical protein
MNIKIIPHTNAMNSVRYDIILMVKLLELLVTLHSFLQLDPSTNP